VSKKTDVFVSGEGTELIDLPLDVARAFSGLINMDDPEHAGMRAIVNAAFTPRQIATLEELVSRRARTILNAVCERGECDFAREVADALPAAVICDLLGVPEADWPEVSRLSRATHPLGDPEFGTFDDAFSAVQELIAYGKSAIAERLESPADDLISALAVEVRQGRLAENDAGTYFMVMVTAGIETTGAAIAHGLLALDERPNERRRWQNDVDGLMQSAIEEILRWSTPVIHFRRTAVTDTILGDQRVAAGDKVVLFYNSANRDEGVFDKPDEFDIGRAPNPHVTFGAGGPHFCLGAHLARLEMNVLFRQLFERFPDIAVAGARVAMHSMFFNGIKSLPCAFTPRVLSR
jgi:cytochrome P450